MVTFELLGGPFDGKRVALPLDVREWGRVDDDGVWHRYERQFVEFLTVNNKIDGLPRRMTYKGVMAAEDVNKREP